jgi:hypothetical protein
LDDRREGRRASGLGSFRNHVLLFTHGSRASGCGGGSRGSRRSPATTTSRRSPSTATIPTRPMRSPTSRGAERCGSSI